MKTKKQYIQPTMEIIKADMDLYLKSDSSMLNVVVNGLDVEEEIEFKPEEPILPTSIWDLAM
jgi:hypothetical protein